MWYFTYWVLSILIKLLCVLAGRSAVDIWWWRFWGWCVLCMVNVDSPWWQWHLNGSRFKLCMTLQFYNFIPHVVVLWNRLAQARSTCCVMQVASCRQHGIQYTERRMYSLTSIYVHHFTCLFFFCTSRAIKVKLKFTLKQATKAHRGSRGVALLFL